MKQAVLNIGTEFGVNFSLLLHTSMSNEHIRDLREELDAFHNRFVEKEIFAREDEVKDAVLDFLEEKKYEVKEIQEVTIELVC